MALSSTERGRRFLARKRAERGALIAAGLEPPKRSRRKAQPAVPVLSATAPRAEATRAMTGIPRRFTPPAPVMPPTRPGGPAAWPRAILYCFTSDSGQPHAMTEQEVEAYIAGRAALRRAWPATDGVALDDLADPGEAWTRPDRRSPGVKALAMLRRGACAWPEGEPSEPGFRFCGCPVHSSGASYCAEHAARCYGKGKP